MRLRLLALFTCAACASIAMLACGGGYPEPATGVTEEEQEPQPQPAGTADDDPKHDDEDDKGDDEVKPKGDPTDDIGDPADQKHDDDESLRRASPAALRKS